jgi:hypothetical protein
MGLPNRRGNCRTTSAALALALFLKVRKSAKLKRVRNRRHDTPPTQPGGIHASHFTLGVLPSNADVAKLADALDLGSKNARHATAPTQ